MMLQASSRRLLSLAKLQSGLRVSPGVTNSLTPRAVTLVTSNLDFTEWDQAFPGNRLLASATVDRLRHNAYCLTLDGTSYRAPRQGPNKAKYRPLSAPRKTPNLAPRRRSSEPIQTGSYMPIIGGSIVPVSDSPGPQERAIDAEVLIRNQLGPFGDGHDAAEDLAHHAFLEQAIPVGRKAQVIPHLFVLAQAD